MAALARSHLFRGCPSTALESLARVAEFRRLERGQMLFLAGEPAGGLFVIVSGSIRAFRVFRVVPVFDDGNYPATAVAEEPSEVLFLSKADVHRFLIANPTVALNALRLMAGRLRRHAELVDSLALKDVGQRLAQLLIAEARAQGTRVIDCSNQQLAARVGSVREVVSRTLARLAQNGLIETRPRGITILDEQALERFAEEGV